MIPSTFTDLLMKLIRFGELGSEKPGVEMDGLRLDVSSKIRDFDGVFFCGGGLA